MSLTEVQLINVKRENKELKEEKNSIKICYYRQSSTDKSFMLSGCGGLKLPKMFGQVAAAKFCPFCGCIAKKEGA